jgi:enterochelin esterase-like enzyme
VTANTAAFAPGARHRFRRVPGYSVGGAVTLQLALDRPELADHVVPRFDHPRGAKDDSPVMRVGP